MVDATGSVDEFIFNNIKILFNSDVTLNKNAKFQGTSSINGNGNTMTVGTNGAITVDASSTLTISDMYIKNVGTGGGTIILTASDSELHLQNVEIQLVGNINTTVGKVRVLGPSTVAVNGNTWTFDTSSELTVDGVTLWKDQLGAGSGDIAFGSPMSSFRTLLNGGTISFKRSSSDTTVLTSRVDEHDSRLYAIDSTDTIQTSRIDAHDAMDATHTSRLDSIDTLNTTQTSRLDTVDSLNATQNARLDAVESTDVTHTSRLDAHDTKDAAQDARLDALESQDVTHTSRLDAVDTKDA